jgi:hypothetical protein
MALETGTTGRPSDDPERPNPAPTAEDVARRAYELSEARRREPGADLDDWLQAERELGFVENSSASVLV